MMTIPAVSLVDGLGALIAVAAPFAAPTVRLYQATITPSPLLALADLTAIECDFDGYAASAAITWGAIHEDPSHNAVVLGPLVPFLCTGSTLPQDVYGYFLVSGGLLVGMEPFETPLPARENLDYIAVVPQMAYGQ